MASLWAILKRQAKRKALRRKFEAEDDACLDDGLWYEWQQVNAFTVEDIDALLRALEQAARNALPGADRMEICEHMAGAIEQSSPKS